MAARKTEKDCCVVTIGYARLLLPADDGLKLVSILRRALEVEREYGGREFRFIVGERPRCELEMVDAKQLRTKPPEEAPARRAPLRLGHDGGQS